ncbi:MAG: hypothetical protein OEZ39_07480 [Gammaproteobacteria bacterium]|nr:hypothetical protein [Gammaproteobacteria bacterium]MDH5651699.1 hypothetical protein [Gammaproteobacteria bacterium]
MPAAGKFILSKGEVMMYLALGELNRTLAAAMAGVSRDTFFRAMRKYNVKAPKPQAKLTNKQVNEIRRLRDQYSVRELAEIFNVHKRTIEQLISYETWRQVD